jgi:1-acyl-sn-glycerol-3-phosphate acyltransferase
MNFLRSLLFTTFMISTVPVIIGPALLLFPLPFPLRFRVMSKWSLFALWWLKVICNLRYEVINPENIPEGPVIIFCKHQSAWETLALQQIFPPFVWVLKKELMWIPIFGWALAVLESVAIDRKSGKKAIDQIVDQGIERLDSGKSIIIFPEGTRVAPGAKKKFGLGGAILAERSGYPVVLVAHNAGHYWPRRTITKKPGVIKIVIGPTIETKDKTASDIKDIAEKWINETTDEISKDLPTV